VSVVGSYVLRFFTFSSRATLDSARMDTCSVKHRSEEDTLSLLKDFDAPELCGVVFVCPVSWGLSYTSWLYGTALVSGFGAGWLVSHELLPSQTCGCVCCGRSVEKLWKIYRSVGKDWPTKDFKKGGQIKKYYEIP
jgi:hypothetical protein